jgi:hypothetical protein
MMKQDFIKQVFTKIESKGFTVFEGEQKSEAVHVKVLHNQTAHSYDLKLQFKNDNYDGFELGGDQEVEHVTRKNYETFDIMNQIESSIREVLFRR